MRPDDRGRLLGVGRWVRLRRRPRAPPRSPYSSPTTCRARAWARALGRALADAARERGVARFTATMLPDNAAAHRLFAHVSDDVQTRIVNGVAQVEGRLAA